MDSTLEHLNQYELAKRWRMSQRTLERWRWLGTGPAYIKVGGRVIYSIDDIKAYETRQKHVTTGSEDVTG